MFAEKTVSINLPYAGGLFKKVVKFSISETIKISLDFTLDTGEKRLLNIGRQKFQFK